MIRLSAGIPVCLVALAMVGCAGASQHPDNATVVAASTASQPAAETPVKPASSQAPQDIVVTGPVTMEQQLDVVALRPGVVSSLNADVDGAVRGGQLLAHLDDRQLSEDRSAADYKVKSLEADLKQSQAEVDIRKTDLRRAEQMRQDGINTQEDLDHARYEVSAVEFQTERQRSAMESAEAALKSIDLELEKTRIVAPFSGEVSQRYVRLGQYLQTGDRVFQITGNSPLEVRFTLPARDSTKLRRGSPVTVSATTDFHVTAEATITQLSPVVDPGSGTVEVTAVLKQKMPGLLPGMVASVRIPRSQ